MRTISPYLRLFLASFLWVLLLAPGPAAAKEGVVSFHSDIEVHEDASLTVVETITIESEGKIFKRGITRDFPTDYRAPNGQRVRVGFDVLEVRRDGKPEPYHSERISNGVRLYVGQKDVFIKKGRHIYEITYRTDRQLGFFDDRDELYWNVTGNGWAMEIGRASARVHLPHGARSIGQSVYTGYEGEQKKDATFSPQADGGVSFETTRPLYPRQGLTIAVAWPPGFVDRPSASQEATYFLRDNVQLIIGLAGLMLLTLYYGAVWTRAGRDPKAGTIVPLYGPPDGFSPAAARYVNRMGYDDKVFAAAVLSMAVKGYLIIHENDQGTYSLERTGRSEAGLSPGERALAHKLFSLGREEIDLQQKNHQTLRSARKALREWLRTEFEKVYFLLNRHYLYPGLGLSAAVILALAATGRQPEVAFFLCVWLSGWTVGVYFIALKAWRAWQAVLAGSMSGLPIAVFATLFATPFVGGELFGLHAFADASSLEAAGFLLIFQGVNAIFYHLMKAPTLLGRRIMDQIAGFADYLSVAEKDRMNFHNPPERTPELFERFLPYALALGVEQAWSEQFSDVLAVAGAAQQGGAGSYSPSWYSGRGWRSGISGTGSLSGFGSSLSGGLSGAISSASTAPGSSGGSGGGGSSGGGGGGGGGGGW